MFFTTTFGSEEFGCSYFRLTALFTKLLDCLLPEELRSETFLPLTALRIFFVPTGVVLAKAGNSSTEGFVNSTSTDIRFAREIA